METSGVLVLRGDDLELWLALERLQTGGPIHRVVEPEENVVGTCAWELSAIANCCPCLWRCVEIGNCIIVYILDKLVYKRSYIEHKIVRLGRRRVITCEIVDNKNYLLLATVGHCRFEVVECQVVVEGATPERGGFLCVPLRPVRQAGNYGVLAVSRHD